MYLTLKAKANKNVRSYIAIPGDQALVLLPYGNRARALIRTISPPARSPVSVLSRESGVVAEHAIPLTESPFRVSSNFLLRSPPRPKAEFCRHIPFGAGSNARARKEAEKCGVKHTSDLPSRPCDKSIRLY